MNIYLFDMDAVLLHPGGYRAALVATVNYFSTAMGLGEMAPSLEEIEAFEAMGITSEWDSASICIAALLAASGWQFRGGFWDAAAILRGNENQNFARPNYRALGARACAEWRPGEYAAEAAYRVLLDGRPPDGLERRLADLLLHTRDINRSPVLPVFQQFTLGADFEPTYGLPQTIETESLLLKFDRPALNRPIPDHSAIYTARPSNPPRDVPALQGLGYAPEAELGAKLVGLSHLPLIGYGSLRWLAETVGGGVHHYVKPSPVHGLAAIGAAAGAPESGALIAAEALLRGEWLSPLKELRGWRGRVTVFEDSASSIRGVREAVKRLGENWKCRGIGISSGGPKYEALIEVADRVFDSLDVAMENALH